MLSSRRCTHLAPATLRRFSRYVAILNPVENQCCLATIGKRRLGELRVPHDRFGAKQFSLFAGNETISGLKLGTWAESELDPGEVYADTDSVLIALQSLATDTNTRGVHLRAERLVLKLERQYEQMLQRHEKHSIHDAISQNHDSSKFAPNADCYECVIKAWQVAAKYEDPTVAVVRAQRWLQKCSIHPLRPSLESYNAFLDICSIGPKPRRTRIDNEKLLRDNAWLAQKTLLFMIAQSQKDIQISNDNGGKALDIEETRGVAPNTDSFNLVIRAWTKCRMDMEIVDRALHVLGLLKKYQEQSPDSSVKPNDKTYALIMDAIGARAKLKVQQVMQRSMTSLDKNDPNNNGLAEIQLIEDMVLFADHAIADINPHGTAKESIHISRNMLLACWANVAPLHKNAPSEAERIMTTMLTCKRVMDNGTKNPQAPDHTSYLQVIRAFAYSKNPDRGTRAMEWLSKQWMDYKFHNYDETLLPTINTYVAVLKTLADVGDHVSAEGLVLDLLLRSETSVDGDSIQSGLKPTTGIYSLLINTYVRVAENGNEDALGKAVKLLGTLEEFARDESLNFSVPARLYSDVMGAARKCVAASSSPDSILDLSFGLFEKARKTRQGLEYIHYTHLLQVGVQALARADQSNARNEFIYSIVRNCQEDGLVSSTFIKAISNGPVYPDGWTIEESKRIMNELFSVWPLPVSWTRNIKDKDQLPKQSYWKRRKFRTSKHRVDPFK